MADKSRTDTTGAAFKKAQRDQDAKKAMSDYDAEAAATRAKTERLRALRLARDAAAPKVEPVAKKAKSAGKKKTKSGSLSDFLDVEKKHGRSS